MADNEKTEEPSKDIVPAPMGTALAALLDGLNWTYDKVISGIPGQSGADKVAEEHLRDVGGDREAAIDSLIRWQIGKASATGFVTNLGGVITLPAAIPANLAGVLYFQVQMVAGIAHLRGYDLRNEKVRTLVIGCLAGNQLTEPLKLAGVMVGNKIAMQALNKLPAAALFSINQMVGIRLLTKAGATGVINFGKLVPVIGGLVGGAFDAVTTKLIADVARNLLVGPPEAPLPDPVEPVAT